jgi:TP901 family phage tail tape measure protein
MADLQKTIQVIFQGTDQMAGAIGSVGSGIDQFAGKVNSATQPLADLTDKLLLTQAALAAMAVGGLAFAYSKAIEFEGASVELKKVLGDQPAILKVLKEAEDKALALSNQYGESAKDILLSTADFKQAGFDVEEAFALTKASMDLVIAGSIESSEAAELLVRILKGFKAPGTEAGQVLDILNEVSNNYAVSTQQLGEGMARLSPIAKQMGFSFAETAGILTPVIEIFQSGDEAANALKTGLLRLIDDNPAIIKALEDIGVAQRDQTGALRSGKDVLLDVMQAFTTLGENEKLYYAQQLVGINQAAKMVEVFNGLEKTLDVTKIAMNSAGSAAAEVAARLESGEVAVNRFKEAFINLAIGIGTEFKNAAKETIDGGTEIEIALQKMIKDGTFDPVFDIINKFASDLGKYLSEIAKVMPEAFKLIKWEDFEKSVGDILESIGGLFKAFFGDLDLTKPKDLAAAFQKSVDSITALNQIVAGIAKSFEPFFKVLGKLVDEILESDEATKKAVGQFLGWGKQINLISGHLGGLTSSLNLLSAAMFTMSGYRILGLIGSMGKLQTATFALTGVLQKLVLPITVAITALQIGDLLRDNIPFLDKQNELFTDLILKLQGVDVKSIEAMEAQAKLTLEMGRAAAVAAKLKVGVDDLPEVKKIDLELENFFESIDTLQMVIEAGEKLPEKKEIELTAKADLAKINETVVQVEEKLFPDGHTVAVLTQPNQRSLAETKKEIEKLPEQKILEIKLQGEIDKEIAQIEAQADTMQTAFEWQAKVDIAEVEAVFSALEVSSQSIAHMFENTGDVILGITRIMGDVDSSRYLDLMTLIKAENVRRDEMIQLEKDITAAQVAFLKAKTDTLSKGEGLIQISSAGVYPELDLVLIEIIRRAQVRATEQGLDLLLGI